MKLGIFSSMKSEEEVKEDLKARTEANRAIRLSQEMRTLALELLDKAEQLEGELNRGEEG